MLQLLVSFLHWVQPLMVPICFVTAWGFIAILGWTALSALRDTANRAKTLHRIPCTRCQFFTNDYRLKCTVRPSAANTERAIDCTDYHQRSPIY